MLKGVDVVGVGIGISGSVGAIVPAFRPRAISFLTICLSFRGGLVALAAA